MQGGGLLKGEERGSNEGNPIVILEKCYPETKSSLETQTHLSVLCHWVIVPPTPCTHQGKPSISVSYSSSKAKARSEPWDGRPGKPPSLSCRTPQRLEPCIILTITEYHQGFKRLPFLSFKGTTASV